jgi:hypothetical protein
LAIVHQGADKLLGDLSTLGLCGYFKIVAIGPRSLDSATDDVARRSIAWNDATEELASLKGLLVRLPTLQAVAEECAHGELIHGVGTGPAAAC